MLNKINGFRYFSLKEIIKLKTDFSNITPKILSHIENPIHNQRANPINTLKNKLE